MVPRLVYKVIVQEVGIVESRRFRCPNSAKDMAKLILDDELWATIQPLLPPPKARRARCPGPKPLDDRAVLTGLLFVLQSGIPWKMLPKEMGFGSGMSCWRRLHAWQKAGVWERLHEVLLAKLRAADRIDWSRVIVEGPMRSSADD